MEAGGTASEPDLQAEIKIPIQSSAVVGDPRVAWSYYVRHYADEARQAKDRKYVASQGGVLYPRASTIGGCAQHSALITMYPNDSDWDHIVQLTGDESWNPHRMRGYFQRLERCQSEQPSSASIRRQRRGFRGWQSIELADPALFTSDPQTARFIQAAETVVGGGTTPQAYLDPNDYETTREEKEGVYSVPLSRKAGARWNVRDHILATAAAYPNLVIMTGCLASRIVLDGSNTARGVEYVTGPNLYRASPLAGSNVPLPQAQQVWAMREVIVAAGTFNSPQLLKLSGIGPEQELSALGIQTRVNLPGVGTGMMDRYEVGVVTQLNQPFSWFGGCTFAADDPCYAAWLQGTGAYTTNGVSIAAIVRSSPDKRVRDLVLLNGTGVAFQGYYPEFQNYVLSPDSQTWVILKAHTLNRAGTVVLRSTDPRDTPLINFRYFDEGTDRAGEDLQALVAGVKLARGLNAEITDLAVGEVLPGPSAQTDGEIAEFVRNEAWGHHASCSNRMGPDHDPMAVVNSSFEVHGTRNLRVVDASVFPKIPGYFITVPILMISEKASDVILAKARSM